MTDRFFTLTIRMENAEMQTDGHLAEVLRDLAYQLAEGDDGTRSNPTREPGKILDINGQTVGSWRIADLESPEKTAEDVVKGTFEIRDGDVQETSASFIRDVIANVIELERGQVR